MANIRDVTPHSVIELAELAAAAADGLSYFRRFPDIEKSRSEIEDGIRLCAILKEGYDVDTCSRGVQVKDIPVWRAFQKMSERVALSAETLSSLASEAVDVRSGLERLLQEKATEASDLKRYQAFFLRLAVSLGL